MMLGADQVASFQEKLQTDLSDHIEFDLSSMNVSRLDSSALYEMHNPASEYINLFASCVPTKMGRRFKKAYDNESVFFGTQKRSCLLYTSPSPRDQRGSRMPSSA